MSLISLYSIDFLYFVSIPRYRNWNRQKKVSSSEEGRRKSSEEGLTDGSYQHGGGRESTALESSFEADQPKGNRSTGRTLSEMASTGT